MHEAFSLIGQGHSTSDHSYQQVSVLDETGLTIRAVTWNTMDKCHSQTATRPYTNNPMNIDENLSQYKARKLAQFKKLFALINEAPADKPLDCIFLEEIDWSRMLTANPQGSIDKVQKELCELFIKEMGKAGWGFVLSPKAPVGAPVSQQTLLTLYNRRSLTPVDGSGTGVLPSGSIMGSNQRYRGYQMTFTHRATGKPVDLVNFHLNYEHDHSEDIVRLMESSIAKGHMVVMGGDANHPPNFAMDTLTGDWDTATAVDKDDDIFKRTGRVVMTTSHIGVQHNNIAKHYDGFCAGSPQALRVIKEEGEHFEMAHNQVRIARDTQNAAHPYHQSEAGYPWIRGRALMVYLDKKLATLPPGAQQQAVLNKMAALASTRFNEALQTAALHVKYPLPNVQRILGRSPNNRAQPANAVPVPAPALDPVDQILQSLNNKHIVISAQARKSLREVLKRLQSGSTHSWNPYFMNSGAKLARIITALSHLRQGSNFQKELKNPASELYKAINMQRISPFTLFGALGLNRAKSLMKIQDALHQRPNRFNH